MGVNSVWQLKSGKCQEIRCQDAKAPQDKYAEKATYYKRIKMCEYQVKEATPVNQHPIIFRHASLIGHTLRFSVRPFAGRCVFFSKHSKGGFV
jgi:hypothetical protein